MECYQHLPLLGGVEPLESGGQTFLELGGQLEWNIHAGQIIHSTEVRSRAFWFALITLFFELCFVVSVWYLEYFDWRSWKEFECVHSLYTSNKQPVYTAKSKGFAVLNPESEPSLENERYIKSRIATAKYRLKKGIGNEETNRQNLENFEKILEGKE